MINMNLRMLTEKNQSNRNPKIYKANQTLELKIYLRRMKKKKFKISKREEAKIKIELAH